MLRAGRNKCGRVLCNILALTTYTVLEGVSGDAAIKIVRVIVRCSKMTAEKICKEKDLEAASHITFTTHSKKKQRQSGLLLASALAATAIIFAVIGLVTGLAVIRSEASKDDGCSTSVTEDPPTVATNEDVTTVEPPYITRCPTHPYPSPLASPLPDKIKSAISLVETQLANLVEEDTLPGLVASITYRDEELWSKGYGVNRKGIDGTTPGTETIYRIASVSKIFVALMVYQLEERGLIRSLDDPLNMFCPTFNINNPFTTENITLRQILSSMSGLPREAPCGVPEDPSINTCPYNTTTILERLSQQSTILPPWTKPSYSNVGFALLGRCLVPYFYPHLSYEDYIELHILKPLGMTGSGFNYSHHNVLESMATGYDQDGNAEPIYDIGWWAPGGQMYSTISDLNKLAVFLYSTGSSENEDVYSSVLSPSRRRLMLLPTYTNRDLETGIGTPWEVSYQNDYTVLMKGGNLKGYSAVFSIVPELQLGLNIVFSGLSSKLIVAKTAYSSLIPAFVETLTKAPMHYPQPPNITQYTGIYTAIWGSGSITLANVHLNGDSLAMSGTALWGIYLAYREPFKFQIEFADHELSCLSNEILALRHTWIYFENSDFSPHSQADSFTMPGFSPGLHFKRI